MTDTTQINMAISHRSDHETQGEVFDLVLAHMAARAWLERVGLDRRMADETFANKLNSILEFKVDWKG